MEKPNLSFWNLWNLSFGFFGVPYAEFLLGTAAVDGYACTARRRNFVG